MIRTRLLALLTVAAIASIAPLSASGPFTDESRTPQGMNAVMEVVSFAEAHPARFGDTPQMALARDYLETKLASHGLEVVKHRYPGGTNILGIIEGTTRPHEWVVVSAHYDTVATPFSGVGATVTGAWDDGAGVAAALEIGRAAALREWNRTVVIAFFDDEEAGLVGSDWFVREWEGRAWKGGAVRLTANVNMDPPGLHWPCVADGVTLPVAVMQARPESEGARFLKDSLWAALLAEGVPEEHIDYFGRGGVQVGILQGTSDNARFGWAGIPDIYLGSSTHLELGGVRLRTMYPLHTPADSFGTMLAYCGGNPATLADAFGVAMNAVWAVLHDVDAYEGAFPRARDA